MRHEANITLALVVPATSLIVAVISGAIALWNRNRTNANSLDIQNLKGVIDEDLEKLKAKLVHGQLVSSTQWNAEFASYQAIWKEIVAIRALAQKIVLRESELKKLDLPDEYLASVDRVEIRKKLAQDFVDASQRLLFAVHDNAPFYPAPIREAANCTHKAAKELIDEYLKALTHLVGGVDVTGGEQFIAKSKTLLLAIVDGTDRVETLIRDRLTAVEVVNRH